MSRAESGRRSLEAGKTDGCILRVITDVTSGMTAGLQAGKTAGWGRKPFMTAGWRLEGQWMAKGRGGDGDTVRWHEPQSPRVVVVVGGGKTPPPPPTPEAQGPGFSEAGRWKDNSPCEPKMLGVLFSILQSSMDLGGRRFQEPGSEA